MDIKCQLKGLQRLPNHNFALCSPIAFASSSPIEFSASSPSQRVISPAVPDEPRLCALDTVEESTEPSYFTVSFLSQDRPYFFMFDMPVFISELTLENERPL